MTTNTDWVATELVWGDAAFEEIKQAFPGKLRARSVALCVWCYARDPDVTEAQIEEMALTDPVIVAERKKKKISAHGQKRAKLLLGLNSDAEPLDPNQVLLAEFEKCQKRLQRSEKALEKARSALGQAPAQAEHAVPQPIESAARQTASAPAPKPAAVRANPEPPHRPPCASDIALEMLHKKVTTTASQSSLASVDDVPSPFPTHGNPVIIEDDFYTMKEEEPVEEFEVFWPADHERLRD